MLIKDLFLRTHTMNENEELMQTDNISEKQTVYNLPHLKTPINKYTKYIQIPLNISAEKTENLNLKTFGLTDDTPAVKVTILPLLKSDHHPHVLRVRLESRLDDEIQLINLKDHTIENDQQYSNRTKVKELPTFINYSALTDEEFQQKYNRVRKQEEYGLIGYIYAPAYFKEQQRSPESTSSATNVQPLKNDQSNNTPLNKKDHSSKLQQAIKIYKGHKNQKRKDVVRKIATQLHMSQAGASSYYTHAKHYVEDEHKPKN